MTSYETAGATGQAAQRQLYSSQGQAHLTAPASDNIHVLPRDSSARQHVGNERCWKMYDEAYDFRGRLTDYEGALARLENATGVFLESVIPALRAPLPRVWDQVEGGLAEPIRATVSHEWSNLVGGDADVDFLKEGITDYSRRLQLDVMRPVGQWRDSLDNVRARMRDLERLRKEVDRHQSKVERNVRNVESAFRTDLISQRTTGRRAGTKGDAFTKHGLSRALYACTHPSVMCNTADDQLVAEVREEDRGVSLTQAQRELQAVAKSYEEQERLMYEQLSGLCRDASWLKSYEVASLVMTKEVFQVSTASLGTTKQPVPSFGRERSSALEHGAVADNDHLIRGMPQFLDGGRENVLDRLKASDNVLTAHYATASPMELHARDDISGYQPLPPVQRGATDVPVASAIAAASPMAPPGGRVLLPAAVASDSGGGGGGGGSGSSLHAIGGQGLGSGGGQVYGQASPGTPQSYKVTPRTAA